MVFKTTAAMRSRSAHVGGGNGMNFFRRWGMTDRYLTVRDVAARWGVSRSDVYQLVSNGLLPSVRVGVGRGTIRVREADVGEYLKQCCRDDAKTFAEHFA